MEVYKDLSSKAVKEFENLLNSQMSKVKIEEGKIVEISGEVISYEMTEDNRFQVTVRKNGKDAICLFSDLIADNIGTDRDIYRGAKIKVRGQCNRAGLFSATPFIMDGCTLIK